MIDTYICYTLVRKLHDKLNVTDIYNMTGAMYPLD